MANLLITRACNRQCRYCFAQGGFLLNAAAAPASAGVHMSIAALEEAIAFVKRSHSGVVGLMGGEPGLHPELPEIVDRLLDAGLRIRLFTGGVVPDPVVDFLAGVDPERVRVVVNIPSPGDRLAAPARRRIDRLLRQLGPHAFASYTICDAHTDLRFLIDTITRFGMHPSVRLGLALPRMETQSPAALPVSEYEAVGRQVVRLARESDRDGFFMELDCGFPRCMFSDRDIEVLRERHCRLVFACSPSVDIGPDLTAWSCFPLESLGRVRIQDFADRAEMVRHFQAQQRPYRNFGIYERCVSCERKRNGECAGGCLAQVIRTFR